VLVRSAVLLSLLLSTVPASVARGDDAVPTTAVTGPTAGLLGVQRARKLPPLIVTCPAESARVGESYISTVGAAGGKGSGGGSAGAAGSGVQSRLADLYVETLSHVRPRIVVHGNPLHLGNPRDVERIRAMLLAAVRAAVLWHQVGGGQFRLLLRRREYAMLARGLLTRCTLDRG